VLEADFVLFKLKKARFMWAFFLVIFYAFIFSVVSQRLLRGEQAVAARTPELNRSRVA
jgi:hypothetical protein